MLPNYNHFALETFLDLLCWITWVALWPVQRAVVRLCDARGAARDDDDVGGRARRVRLQRQVAHARHQLGEVRI